MLSLFFKFGFWLKSILSTIFKLVDEYPWQSTCFGLVLALMLVIHGKAALKADNSKLKIANSQLISSINAQNASINALKQESDSRQKAAHTALQQAQEHGEHLSKLAYKIELAAPSTPPVANCTTPAEVMSARGEL